jgi:methyl-accepting chemotaxis protein
LKRKNITVKFWLLIGIAWGAGTISAGFLTHSLNRVSATYDDLFEREVRMQDSARQMQVKFKLQVQEWKDVLLRGQDPDALKKYAQAFQEKEKAVRDMAEALKRDAPDRETRAIAGDFAQAHVEMGSKYASALRAFIEANGLNQREVDGMVKGQDRAPTALVDRLVDLLRERANRARSSQKERLTAQSRAVSITLLLAFGGVGVMSFLTIRGLAGTLRQTTSELRDAAGQVSAAAGQVSAASQSLAAGASEQAASLDSTSATTEKIAELTKLNANLAQECVTTMVRAQAIGRSGLGAVTQLTEAVNAMQASSQKISTILSVIEGVAFQTNILALNAAVEAARAGAAGAGFAVVADEVRSLAQRSAQAAKDTAELVEGNRSSAHEAAARLEAVTASLQQSAGIRAAVESVADRLADSADKQSAHVQHVVGAILQIRQVTQQSAAGAEENAAASEELNAQSLSLKDTVERLSALIDGA